MVRKLIERVKRAAQKGLVLHEFKDTAGKLGYLAVIGRRLKTSEKRIFVPLTPAELEKAETDDLHSGGMAFKVDHSKQHFVITHFVPFNPVTPVFSRGGVFFQPRGTDLQLGPKMARAVIAHLASQPKYASYTIAHHEEGETFGPGVADIADEVGVDRNKSYKLTEYAEAIKRKIK